MSVTEALLDRLAMLNPQDGIPLKTPGSDYVIIHVSGPSDTNRRLSGRAAADVIDDGRTGLLVAAADVPALTAAVRSLLADEARRSAMGAAARQAVAADFTVDAMAHRYAEQYRQVLSRG